MNKPHTLRLTAVGWALVIMMPLLGGEWGCSDDEPCRAMCDRLWNCGLLPSDLADEGEEGEEIKESCTTKCSRSSQDAQINVQRCLDRHRSCDGKDADAIKACLDDLGLPSQPFSSLSFRLLPEMPGILINNTNHLVCPDHSKDITVQCDSGDCKPEITNFCQALGGPQVSIVLSRGQERPQEVITGSCEELLQRQPLRVDGLSPGCYSIDLRFRRIRQATQVGGQSGASGGASGGLAGDWGFAGEGGSTGGAVAGSSGGLLGGGAGAASPCEDCPCPVEQAGVGGADSPSAGQVSASCQVLHGRRATIRANAELRGSPFEQNLAYILLPKLEANSNVEQFIKAGIFACEGSSRQSCSNHCDDDGDHLTDCDDPDCAVQCLLLTERLCGDGIDNDDDGKTDCDDSDCASWPSCRKDGGGSTE